jgi:glycosyltransferase involved in cell wall biosynthesis
MPKLALSMIVRDAAESLRACLESARDAVDELVIADTGSADETPATAQEFGAKVIRVPWQDNFAAARNLALASVTADWVLTLDADEMLDPEGASGIRELLESGPTGGYQVTIRNYVLRLEDRIWDRPARANDSRLPAAQSYPAYVEHENVRLFRRDPRIRFVGRVHESVGPSIEGSGLRLGRAPFLIHHFGLASDAKTRARKNVFYRDLGRQKILEMPDSFQAHLELGVVELDNFANTRQAVEHFDRACTLNPKFGVAWFFAGLGRVKLGEYREAIECLRNAANEGHRTSFVFETTGDAHYNLGEFSDAARAYERAIQIAAGSPPLESKLGLAAVRAGQTENGLAKIRDALKREPAHPEIHDRLILSLAWLGKERDAATAAEEKLKSVRDPLPSDFLRAATLWAGLGEWPRAGAILHVGTVVYPQNEVLKQALSELSKREGSGVKGVLERLTEEVGIGVGISDRS